MTCTGEQKGEHLSVLCPSPDRASTSPLTLPAQATLCKHSCGHQSAGLLLTTSSMTVDHLSTVTCKLNRHLQGPGHGLLLMLDELGPLPVYCEAAYTLCVCIIAAVAVVTGHWQPMRLMCRTVTCSRKPASLEVTSGNFVNISLRRHIVVYTCMPTLCDINFECNMLLWDPAGAKGGAGQTPIGVRPTPYPRPSECNVLNGVSWQLL